MSGKLRTKPMPVLTAAGRRRQKGKGFLDFIKKVGSTVVDGAKAIASKVKPSQVLGFIPDQRAQAAARVAGAIGLGRKKKVGGKRKTTGGKRKTMSGKRKTMSGTGSAAAISNTISM